MAFKKISFRIWLVLVITLPGLPAYAGTLKVAVASNFAKTMGELARQFEKKTGHKLILSSGSTGKHYAQIRNGAPFDAFFAADSKRPALLEQQESIVPLSRYTYAIGELVLWSQRENLVDPAGEILAKNNFHYLAIANPLLAPYGRAAKEVLQSRNLWKKLKNRIVRGENINQAYQFVSSGNAEIGFVARSQLIRQQGNISGSYWIVPQALYSPIEQQLVLLKESEAGRQLLDYMRSHEALMIINDHGYRTR